jgi:hypothetical protein
VRRRAVRGFSFYEGLLSLKEIGMRLVVAASLAAALLARPVLAAAQAPPPAGAQQPGAATAPAVPATATAPAAGRTFTAPVGLLFNTVRPERVADFEKVLGYLQAALQKSSDPNVQAQARGWRMFKASEPGPNTTVLYVFQFDPTVPGADYGLGRILAEAYPDAALLQEIWRLYTTSVTSGGSLLNLTPVVPVDPLAGAAPGSTITAPEPRMLPPDANPVRRP